MNKGLMILLSAIFFSIQLLAQPITTNCVDFEQFPEGLTFGPSTGLEPGDVILGEEGLNVSLEEFLFENGNTEFSDFIIQNNTFPLLDENYFYMVTSSVNMDFSSAQGSVQGVCFDYALLGETLNFSVNGSPVFVTNDVSEISLLDIPGITVSASSTGSNSQTGVICVDGTIESLLIGGVELGIDNVCFETNTDCGIINLEAETVECGEDGSYDIEIDFDHLSPSNDTVGFDVLVNGEQVAYIQPGSSLPYTINGVFPGSIDNSNGNLTFLEASGPFAQLPFAAAAFGPPVPDNGLSGIVVNAFDDSANPSFVCNDVVNANEVAGNIALIDRMGCTFEEKVRNAEAAGAIGVIICNFENVLIEMAGDNDNTDPSIPAVMLTEANCQFIRSLMEDDDELNISLSPDAPNSNFELTVCVNDNPNCCSTIEVAPDCPDNQPSDCIGFEPLQPGDVYGSSANTQPGQPFYNENGIGMFLLPFQTLFWTTTYGDLNVLSAADQPEMNAAVGSYLQFESVNAVFDLTGYSDPIDSITLDFYYTGGGINIAANGAAFLIQNNLQAGFYALAPGISVQVIYNSNLEGQLTFFGNVQSLLIGGEGDFRVDNLCINPTQDCSIENLIVETTPCNPNNVFSIDVDFEYSGTSDTFALYLFDELTAYYAYEDLPITISPLVGPVDAFSLQIVDGANPTCNASVTVPAVDCDDCNLEGITLISDPFCLGVQEPFYQATIEVLGAESGDSLVVTSLMTGQSFVSIYDGQSLTFEFPFNDNNFEELEVCQLDGSGSIICCQNISFDIGCPTCEIVNLVIEPFCDGDSLFYFDLDFEVLGTFSDTFVLDLDNGFHAEFAYSDLPVTLGPVSGANGEILFTWLFDDTGECGTNTFLQSPDCVDGCVLGEVTAPIAAAGCNNDGTYNIPLAIENVLNGELLYIESLTTGFADTLTYGINGASLVQLSSWPAPPNGADSLLICLFDQPNCCVDYAFIVDCEVECDFTADVSLLECEPNGVMTFQVSTTSNDPNAGPFIGVRIDGQFFGLFGINTTVEVGLVVNDGSFDILDVEVQLWENQSAPSCSIIVPVDVSDCSSDCEIPGLEVFTEGCTQFGAYSAFINMFGDSINQNIDIYANGDLVISDINPGPVSIEVFAYNPGDTPDVISVCYTDDPDCCESVEITPPLCDCDNIYAIIPEVSPCENGEYSIIVDLETDGFFGEDFFIETSNGFSGVFNTLNLPVTIGPFEGNGEFVTIAAYPFGDCQSASVGIDAPDCETLCELPSVDFNYECTNDGAILDITFTNIPAGNNFYTFEIPQLGLSETIVLNDPISYSYFLTYPIDPQFLEVILCSEQSPNCCESYGIDIPCTPPCDINAWPFDTVVVDCINNEFYTNSVEIIGALPGSTIEIFSEYTDFSTTTVANDNGTAFVTYTFPIPPNNSSTDLIIVCDQNNSSCCTEFEVIIECSQSCGVAEAIWNYECINDNTLLLTIDSVLTFGNPQGPFYVDIEGFGLEEFELNDLPLSITLPLANTNPEEVFFIVGSEGCNGIYLTTFTPDCGIEGCLFSSVVAEPYGCNDGQFMLDIEVDVNEPGPLGYYVFADGQIFGPFDYNNSFVTIGPLEGDNETIYDLLILDIADPTCFGYAEIGPVDCDTDEPCAINDLSITTQDCIDGGTYGMTIDFNTNAPANSFFNVYGSNDQELGFYPVFALPVTIQGVDPNNTGINEITVCFVNSLNCCASQTITEPDCPDDCVISNVEVDLAFCDTSGFYVQLSFDFDNPVSGFYSVFGNGEDYGMFSYNASQLVIGPFDPFTDNLYELVVQDTADADCSGFVEFPAFDCDGGNCTISNVEAEYAYCDTTGFYMQLSFDVSNPDADGYTVQGNGMNYGLFSYSDPFPIIGPFEYEEGFVYELIVVDLENDNCSDFTSFEGVDCDEINEENCLNLEVSDIETFSPQNDYYDGDVILELPEATVSLMIESDTCTVCAVELAQAVDYPDFTTADGLLFALNYAGLNFDLGNTNGLTRHFYLEFNEKNDNIWVAVNGGPLQPYSFFNELYNVTDDVEMVIQYGNNGYGAISLTGPVETITIFSIPAFEIDNICITEFEEENNCIEFVALNQVLEDTIVNISGFFNPDGMFLEEEGVIMTSTAINGGSFQGIFGATEYPCDLDMDTEGGFIQLVGGVQFDFSLLEDYPNQITFDLYECYSDQFYLEINQDVFNGQPEDLPMMVGGILVEATPTNNNEQWLISMTGTVEQFVVGGNYTLVDNFCFSTEEPVGDCVTFSTFNDIVDTVFLADYAQPWEFFYEENGVDFTASSIFHNGNPNYFGGIIAYAEPTCGFDTEGAILYVSGSLDMDFTDLGPVGSVSLDISTCLNTSTEFRISVNGAVYEGTLANLPPVLGGIEIELSASPLNIQSSLLFEGDVELLSIGATGYSIDNICVGEQQFISEVWPGDANNDGIAHHADLLNIGIAYGQQGSARAIDGNAWLALDATNWDDMFADSINYKHADCNGDGVINADDRQAILANYNLTHGSVSELESLPYTDVDPPIFVDFNAEIPEAATFNVPIIAGSAEYPIQDIYGIAFTVEFDPDVIPGTSIQVVYPTSWFGEPDVNTINVDRTYMDEGKLEIALSRTDGNNVSGFGDIAYIIGIIDDIAGLKLDSEIRITKVKAIDKLEKRQALSTPEIEFLVNGKEDNNGEGMAEGIFTLYPNPTSDWVTIGSRHGFEPEELILMSVSGQTLNVPQEGNNRISLEQVPAGMYVLRIISGKTQVHKFIVRQ